MGHSRPDWPARVMSGLAPIAAEERTSRIGSLVPQMEIYRRMSTFMLTLWMAAVPAPFHKAG
jgi:hypothetical protein